jgi:hypothetical protein
MKSFTLTQLRVMGVIGRGVSDPRPIIIPPDNTIAT